MFIKFSVISCKFKHLQNEFFQPVPVQPSKDTGLLNLHGEENTGQELETHNDSSKFGQVNKSLSKGMQLSKDNFTQSQLPHST